MFGSIDTSNFPTIHDYADAVQLMRTTIPMRSGPNKGVIPLRTNRKDSGIYRLIHNPRGRHNMLGAGEPDVPCVEVWMYNTAIVSYFADGTIEIDDYQSQATNKVQSAVLPFHGGGWSTTISDWNGIKVFSAGDNTVRTPLGCGVGKWNDVGNYPFVHGPITLLKLPDGRYAPYGFGFTQGFSRAYYDPLVRQLMTQVHNQLRGLCRMAGREKESDVTPEEKALMDVYPDSAFDHYTVSTMTLREAHEYLWSVIDEHGWEPKQPICPDMMQAILHEPDYPGSHRQWVNGMGWAKVPSENSSWHVRTKHWNVLRQEVRVLETWTDALEPLTEAQAARMQADIEDLRDGVLREVLEGGGV